MVLGQASRDICCGAVCHNKLWLPYIRCASCRFSSPPWGRRAVAAESRVLVDARPLQGPDAVRGIGSYVRGLLAGFLEAGFDRRTALLLDAGPPPPAPPPSDFAAYSIRRRYSGRFGL